MKTFYEVVTEAVKDMTEYGYDSQTRVNKWLVAIRDAAVRSLVPEAKMQATLKGTFQTIYTRMVTNGKLLKLQPGVARFNLDRVKPKLRSELERRIASSANLIKLNREQMLTKTAQRFSGWATSIPAGGSDAVDKVDTKADIKKALAQLPFEERRVAIDQGHKFVAALNDILAKDAGVLAYTWHSHWRQPGYDYREDHKERDQKIYLIRGSWALEKGLIKPGPAGYYDEITSAGEEVFCRCNVTGIFALRGLPDNMLTDKGRAELKRVQIERAKQ